MLSKKQQEIVNANNKTIVVMASAAAGKALENNSIVYTDNGPIKIQHLKIGDKIYGEDGKIHSVLGVFPQGKKKKFEVTFSDGNKIYCCDEHLWTFQTESLRSSKSKKWITATLQEIIEQYPLFVPARAKNNFGKNPTKRKNIFIPMTQPINFSKKQLPLKPYLLGALLGDGCLGSAGVTTTFSNADSDILERVKNELKEINCDLIYTDRYDYRIKQNVGKGKKGKLTSILEELSIDGTRSDNKFIPNIYKYSCIEDRIELLKGLIDTDGYCDKSSYDIVLKSKQLILDIKEVVESLGLTATYQEKRAVCVKSKNDKKDCGIVYRLRIKTSKQIQKLHYSQKREKQWKPSKVYSHRAIIDIKELNEEVDMTCISIDNPTELFLTNNFIVTHNTRLLIERVRRLLNEGEDPKKIALITFTNAAAAEMRKRIGEKAKDCFIGTIHSYANYILLINGYSTREYIENDDFDKLFDLISKVKELPHVKHLLLDEAQDTDRKQWEFILHHIVPENLFVVGDIKQELYNWRGSDVDTLKGLYLLKDSKVFYLNENYRNGKNILNYASGIMLSNKLPYEYRDDSICCSNRDGNVIKHDLDYNWIARTVSTIDTYKDWFILTRSNQQLDLIKNQLEKRKIPCTTFRQADLDNESLMDVMNSNTVKILTIHSSKGLENKNVMVYGMLFWNKDELCCSYVAATRAKERLYILKTPKREQKLKTKITNWE